MPRLRLLEIIDSRVTFIPAVCAAQGLRTLNVSSNAITSLHNAGLGCLNGTKLPNLELLDVMRNRITEIPVILEKVTPNLVRFTAGENAISSIEPRAFGSLQGLKWLDLVDNSLTRLDSNLLSNCTELDILGLSRNDLAEIPKGLLSGLRKLRHLDLATVNANDTVWKELRGLEKLVTLNMQANRLIRIDEDVLAGLPYLQYVNLSSNTIESVPRTVFKAQYSLKKLHLSNNTIRSIPRKTFKSQFLLEYLDLSKNLILSVDATAFTGLRKLRHLDLSSNLLSYLGEGSFDGLNSLTVLNISSNILEVSPSFRDLSALKYLDLDRNNLTQIDSLSLSGLTSLRSLSLKDNRLQSIPANAFQECAKLQMLNFARNEIRHLANTAFLGLEDLDYLNLENNRIEELGTSLNSLRITYLYMGSNRLNKVYRGQLPDFLHIIDLSDNNLNYISPWTFNTMNLLKRVRIDFNNLTTLPRAAMELSHKVSPKPEFIIHPNPFVCDCNLGWLKDWTQNQVMDDSIVLPNFKFIYTLECDSPYDGNEKLLAIPRSHFLCKYEEKCMSNCLCCGYTHCHCLYECPSDCSCFIGDDVLDINRIHCENKNMSSIPSAMPAGATEVFMDGNDVVSVNRHAFLGLSKVRTLYMNNSNVDNIENGSFVGLKDLRKLFLQDNNISIIFSATFRGLSRLEELHIDNNNLFYLEPDVFESMAHLKYVSMVRNKLQFLSTEVLETLTNRSSTVQIRLAENPWSCNASFMCGFKSFVYSHSTSFPDASQIRCYDVHSSDPAMAVIGIRLADFHDVSCVENTTEVRNVTVDSVVTRGKPDHMFALIAVGAASVLLVGVVVVLIWQKDLLQLWCFTKFGWRFLGRDADAGDQNRLYDAFVSYSNRDESFVFRELMPQLERGEKRYKLCLHDRDFPVGASIAETIVQCVESSKRVILVLSDNFLENEWCRFELETAHQQVLKERKNRLIMVLLSDMSEAKMNPLLKMHLKTRTYVKHGDPWFWEKIYFAMPDVDTDKVYRENARGACTNGHVNRAHDTGSMDIADQVLNSHYEIPVANGVYQCLDSAHSTDMSNYNSSGHYEEIGPPGESKVQPTAPPLPNPRTTSLKPVEYV